MKAALALLLFSAVAFGQSDSPGMYAKSGNDWVRLEKVAPLGVKAKNVEAAMIGIAPSTVAKYPGRASAVSLPASPVFRYVRAKDREDFSARSVRFVRMDEKDDAREVRLGKGSKVETDGKKTFSAVVKSEGDNVYTIEPSAPLQPGQYIMLYGMNPVGYDFTVSGG